MGHIPLWIELKMKNKIDIFKNNPYTTMFSGILAGLFIGLGSLFMALLKQQGFNSLIFSVGFSIGLFAIVVIGCDLFTGNCLLFLLYFKKKSEYDVGLFHKFLAVNWLSNFMGIILVICLTYICGFDTSTMSDIAIKKCTLSSLDIWGRGILCNILVCLAVWMANFSDKDIGIFNKFIAVLFPVTMFVFCGCEHSIANMYFLPFGVFSGNISVFTALLQLSIVTFSNYIGGFIFSLLLYKRI